jgi:polyisoprenoid-binding protein YceI
MKSLLLSATACIGLLGFAKQDEPKKLIVEPNHSTIQFSVPISNGLTRITGKFNEFTIDIELVGNDITKSRMSAIIKVNSISTGIIARDEDLITKDFFDSEKFPEITFVSDRIEKNGSEFIAHGKFQMHGVTKAISLPFRITGQDGEDIIGFSSRYSIKRTDFGVGTNFKHTSNDNFIGNDIGVEIDFWTKKPKSKK